MVVVGRADVWVANGHKMSFQPEVSYYHPNTWNRTTLNVGVEELGCRMAYH